MNESIPASGLQLRSLVNQDGTLELSLAEVALPPLADDEVLVRVDASPVNPSDLGLLLGGADPQTFSATTVNNRPAMTARLTEPALRAATARIGQALPAGNEGAGQVLAAGADAQSLVGKTVAILGGAMYAQYRVIKARQCLLLPAGVTAEQGASCFVNPLTALGMVETMREEGHSALVHTAAASNLGQMLVKICLQDGVELVNIVRRPEQADLLRGIGARHVVDSSQQDFADALTEALVASGATIAFDATGGGNLASRILTCMERAQARTATEFSRYGSSVHKQVYIYGGLDRSPTTLNRAYGMAWGVGGWLLTPFLQKIGPAAAQALRERVAANVTTTFASHYSHRVSLTDLFDVATMQACARMATGEKYLVIPN